jgi:hypothetical protein
MMIKDDVTTKHEIFLPVSFVLESVFSAGGPEELSFPKNILWRPGSPDKNQQAVIFLAKMCILCVFSAVFTRDTSDNVS